jgi:hypothetical protein
MRLVDVVHRFGLRAEITNPDLFITLASLVFFNVNETCFCTAAAGIASSASQRLLVTLGRIFSPKNKSNHSMRDRNR